MNKMNFIDPITRKDFYKDDELIHEAKSKRATFLINLSSILNCNFVNRAKLLNNLRIFVKKCIKRNAPFQFKVNSSNSFESKNQRELTAIFCMIGLTRPQSEKFAKNVIK